MFAVAKLKLYAIAVGAFLLGILGVFLRGRAVGKKAAETKHVEERLEAEVHKSEIVTKTHEIQSDITGLPTIDLGKRLQDRWTRD